jgi:hypothetical protein
MAKGFDENEVYHGRIAYIQGSTPSGMDGVTATMFTGKILHKSKEPVGDGRLWEMVDCDIIIIPRKRYAQSNNKQVHSIDYIRSIMGKMDEWEEVQNG